ncbi:MAG: hypothetical protein HC827_09635 [Cyanobacteria bacterium RM1_2_2]|nr:hypothetical protein [Leptolyngbyaceae cyanobacterium SM1_4_3]NJO78758.1 hypothetical protein [Cyanobacteria bacterium RM1_2_2]
MASSKHLHGIELVDCAKANAKQGLAVATHLCGYGEDTAAFQQELKQACQQMGVEISDLTDLITEQQTMVQTGGVEISPETPSEL